ncbi:MAG: hypothetical protein AB7T22_16280, partial [Calditrichaceae bacterium]
MTNLRKSIMAGISIVFFTVLVSPALLLADINSVGSFEGDMPSYWTKGSVPGGSTLDWATDASRNMGRSLKITKEATGDSAAWISENMLDLWSPQHYKDVDIFVGAWVKTENVNVNPVNEDEKWYVSYTFYNESGEFIGETKLPIDQSVASSSGWVADTNAVGATILPEDSWKTIIKFVGGKNAIGTVWADDFMLYGRDGAWAGQNWNSSVGVSTGWNYWLPPVGGNDGELANGFENTVITDEESYTGLYSLKLDLPFDRAPHDGWIGTKRYLLNSESAPLKTTSTMDVSELNGISAGDVLRISVWIKASDLVPDSAAAYPGTWSVGITPIFHSGYLSNDGYDEIGAQDLVFTFPAVTSFGWTEYYVDVTVPADPNAKALSVRIHPYARFTGTVYFDELTVRKLDIPEISGVGSFEGDMPSYWTKGSVPGGSTLDWATDASRNMGRSLKITKEATGDS